MLMLGARCAPSNLDVGHIAHTAPADPKSDINPGRSIAYESIYELLGQASSSNYLWYDLSEQLLNIEMLRSQRLQYRTRAALLSMA